MGAPAQIKRLNEQRQLAKLDRALIISDLYCKGMSQRAIAEKLGVHRGTVQKGVELMRQIWRDRLGDTIEAHRAEQLAKIDKVESEAWEAWEKSKKAAIELERGETPKGSTSKKKRKFRDGEHRWLEIISKQVEMRIRLLGLDKPESTGGSATPLLEVIVSTRAEAAKMLPYMDFANDVEGHVVESSESADVDN